MDICSKEKFWLKVHTTFVHVLLHWYMLIVMGTR